MEIVSGGDDGDDEEDDDGDECIIDGGGVQEIAVPEFTIETPSQSVVEPESKMLCSYLLALYLITNNENINPLTLISEYMSGLS